MADELENSQICFEEIEIQLPDLEETQIVDEVDDQREVSLFTNVNKESGKVIGAESTPFVLPRRWTFDTLKLCVTDYINRQRKGLNPLVIKQLYYKRASGKKVVEMHSDGDISALLKQYPMTYPSGKRKRSCTMYLAVDAQEEPSHCTSDSVTPRRSPRLAKHSYAVYLHKFVDGKVGNTAEVITDFDRHDSLDKLIQHIATENSSEYIYKPENGIYWLRKGTKQPVSMKTNLDFDVGKKEYGGSNSIRIACTAVEVDKSSTASSGMTSKTRRKLDMRSTSSDNELWNELHLILVRDLEKKGILWRYGVKHLKLWTDMIANGELAGAGEEPVWDQHLDQIITPPKSKRSSPAPTSSDNFGQQPRLMEMLLIQNQTLMTMMASNMAAAQNQKFPGSPLLSPISGASCLPSSLSGVQLAGPSSACGYEISPSVADQEKLKGNDLKRFTLQECCNFLTSLGLGHLNSVFEVNNMDGPLLLALIHPQLGEVMLDTMGLSPSDKYLLVRGIEEFLKM